MEVPEKEKGRIECSCVLAMSLVGIYTKEYKAGSHTDIHAPMFAAELVTLVKTIQSGLELGLGLGLELAILVEATEMSINISIYIKV